MKREKRKKSKVLWFLKLLSFYAILLAVSFIIKDVREYVEANTTHDVLNLGKDYYKHQAYMLKNYEIAKYFVIPVFDGWTTTKIDHKEMDCDEVILLTKNSINVIIFLEDYHVENGDISQIQDNLYEELKNKYPNYSFRKSDKLRGNAAIVDADYNNNEDYMHILVAKIADKLITVSYSYKMSDIYEAELYFFNLAGNVNRVVKGV